MGTRAGHPGAPRKGLPDHVADQKVFLGAHRKPRLDRAVAGRGHVRFAGAAHLVFGTYPCCLWPTARVLVRAASGRQRLDVLGAWDAAARPPTTVTNTTAVNTDTMCDLLRAVAARGWQVRSPWSRVTPGIDGTTS